MLCSASIYAKVILLYKYVYRQNYVWVTFESKQSLFFNKNIYLITSLF